MIGDLGKRLFALDVLWVKSNNNKTCEWGFSRELPDLLNDDNSMQVKHGAVPHLSYSVASSLLLTKTIMIASLSVLKVMGESEVEIR